jgi:hypothetical protein
METTPKKFEDANRLLQIVNRVWIIGKGEASIFCPLKSLASLS